MEEGKGSREKKKNPLLREISGKWAEGEDEFESLREEDPTRVFPLKRGGGGIFLLGFQFFFSASFVGGMGLERRNNERNHHTKLEREIWSITRSIKFVPEKTCFCRMFFCNFELGIVQYQSA